MLSIYKKLYALLTQQERRRAFQVLVLIFCMALLDMAGVASIMPFMALLANPTVVETNVYLSTAYNTLGFEDKNAFLVFVGVVVLVLFVGSLIFKALNTYAINRFATMRSYAFSYRLLAGYLNQPYDFFLGRNTADLSKTIFSEVAEIINGALIPALKVVSGGIVSLMIIILLYVVNPLLTIIVGVVLGSAFAGVYLVSRRYLQRLGEERVWTNQQRFVLASEALGGIKELLLMGRERNYLERFSKVAKRFAVTQASHKVIGDLPHFAIQAIAFGGVLVLVINLIGRHGGVEGALPMIALYVFAGYRILPALQELFKNLTLLRYHGAALDSLHHDLVVLPMADIDRNKRKPAGDETRLSGDIEFERVSFVYPGVEKAALHDLSLRIVKGSSVAFVGSTGAGKSTAVDLVLGLLKPSQGRILVAGQPIGEANLRKWQNNIGYVPQSIYLADASVAENIAFGVPSSQIDMQAVENAAKAANIHDFIVGQLPNGYATSAGERGVRLSGGQRQRIGIARALYHNPEVVVFDEATSALDNATEASVMEAVDSLKGQKTILLIAHRLTTVKQCDNIFYLNNGVLHGSGTYGELLASNSDFSQMVAGRVNEGS